MPLYQFDQQNSLVPVAVLSKLDNTILIRNEISSSGWYISGAKVMVTRFWASSNASLVLTCDSTVTSNGLAPQLPENIGLQGLESEFCIWLGYLEGLRPVVQTDLGTRLKRVFIGVLENIAVTCSAAGGVTANLEFRDRMKWLMDSELYFIPVDLISANLYTRSDMIFDISNRAIGSVTNVEGCPSCGKKILQGNIIDIDKTPATAPANNWYQKGQPLSGAPTSPDAPITSEHPSMNIHTTRVSLGTDSSSPDAQNFLLSGQLPVEAIKTLAMQEVFPTEFFQNHQDGNFYYAPRANDSSGLTDPERFYRTYIWQDVNNPVNVNIKPAQVLIGLKLEMSSLALKTNFIISRTSVAQNDYLADISMHLRAKPYGLRGKNYACKFTTVTDPTIRNEAEMALVALSMARIWAREENIGMMVLLGDPSIVPGEVVQVLGSPLLPGGGFSVATTDRENYIKYDTAWNTNIGTYAQWASTGDPAALNGTLHDGTIYNLNPVGKDANNGKNNGEAGTNRKDGAETLFCDPNSVVNFNQPPQTIYRVEALVHKFNQGTKGYVTEVALVTPF